MMMSPESYLKIVMQTNYNGRNIFLLINLKKMCTKCSDSGWVELISMVESIYPHLFKNRFSPRTGLLVTNHLARRGSLHLMNPKRLCSYVGGLQFRSIYLACLLVCLLARKGVLPLLSLTEWMKLCWCVLPSRNSMDFAGRLFYKIQHPPF